MAVSITSNLDLAQLLSKRPSGDPANSSKNSAKVGSDSDPQWNGVQQSDASNTADPEQAFSTALQDALAAVDTQSVPTANSKPAPPALQGFPGQTKTVSSAPSGTQMTPSAPPGTQAVKPPDPTAPTIPVLAGNSNSQDLLSLLFSSQKVVTPTPAKDSGDSESTQQKIATDAASPSIGLAYLTTSAPAQSAPLAPAAVDPTAVKAEVLPLAFGMPNPASLAAAAATAASAPGAPKESLNIPPATESIVFDGHLTASPKEDAGPSAPAQLVSNRIPDARLQPPVQPTAQPAQSLTPSQPQSQADPPRPPASSNAAALSVDTVGTPPIAVGSSAGKNSSFGQEMKQDGKPSGQNQIPALPSPLHSSASANFPPQGAQNNLNGAQQTSASSNGDSQPIVNQSSSVQTNLKTDMNLKMQSQSGDNITVRLSERAGGIQVTVRSSDPSTSAMLRHELPNIQAGLEQAGWQLSGTSSQHTPSVQHSNSNSQSADQGAKDQRSGYGAQEQQKRRNNAQHQWFELMQ